MNSCKNKLLMIFSAILVLVFSITLITNADNIAESIQAYRGVKVLYNGQELKADKQPYIINSTTYVPLRMLMDNFGKDISYDSSANRVIIKDKENANEISLNKKIDELNKKIDTLQSENNKLQSENDTLKSKNTALTTENTKLSNKIAALEEDDDELVEIEDDLYDDYGDAGEDYFEDENLDVSISLDGDEDDLEFEIYIDFSDSDDNDDLTEVSSTDIKSLMKAIYEDIEDYIEDTDYEDAEITGTIEDDSDNNVEYDGSTFDFSW